VEELALQHYASAAGGGWLGVHTEGGVWRSLFGLLLWDVLFTPLPEVFRTPFQTAPLDLGSDAFYPARREALDARLQLVGGRGGWGGWAVGRWGGEGGAEVICGAWLGGGE
jgi:Fanconi-associated nuclease 1